MRENQVAAGTVTGTGAAINVVLGFTPRYVEVVNVASGGLVTAKWFQGMAAASAVKQAAAGTTSVITSNGISEYAGSAGVESKGFTIGADTDLNVSGEAMYYIALA